MNFFNREDCFRGTNLLDLKVKVILLISGLLELSIEYYVSVET